MCTSLDFRQRFCKDPQKIACFGTFGCKLACLVMKTLKNLKFETYWPTLLPSPHPSLRSTFLSLLASQNYLQNCSRLLIWSLYRSVWFVKWKNSKKYPNIASLSAAFYSSFQNIFQQRTKYYVQFKRLFPVWCFKYQTKLL